MIDDEDIDGLAAEFALGSLPPGERSAVAARMRGDQRLAGAIAAWEHRLSPLSHREPGLEPPRHVLEGVLAGITRRAVAGQEAGTVVVLRRRVGVWRLAAATMAATAACLAIILASMTLGWLPDRSRPLVAVLVKGANSAADEPSVSTSPVFLATFEPRARTLTLRHVSGRRPPADRFYALWLVDDSGARSTLLGMLPRGEAAVTLPLGEGAGNIESQSLAVSVEANAAVRQPSGPVVSVGRLEVPAR